MRLDVTPRKLVKLVFECLVLQQVSLLSLFIYFFKRGKVFLGVGLCCVCGVITYNRICIFLETPI